MHTPCVIYSTNIDTVMYYNFTSEDSGHYLLAKLLYYSWVILDIEKWFKQTHSVGYSMNIYTVLFYPFTSEDIRHTLLAHLQC